MTNMEGKTGALVKGRITPSTIPDAQQVPCPAASNEGTIIFHSIINIENKMICEFCKDEWSKIDQSLREACKRADAERAAAKRARTR